VQLQGLLPTPLEVTPILAQQLYKATKGNDAWAFVILDTASDTSTIESKHQQPAPLELTSILEQYEDVFKDHQ